MYIGLYRYIVIQIIYRSIDGKIRTSYPFKLGSRSEVTNCRRMGVLQIFNQIGWSTRQPSWVGLSDIWKMSIIIDNENCPALILSYEIVINDKLRINGNFEALVVSHVCRWLKCLRGVNWSGFGKPAALLGLARFMVVKIINYF